MRTFGVILLVATYAIYNSEASTPTRTPTATVAHPTTTQPATGTGGTSTSECVMQPCARIFDPVCCTENGIQFQAANFCEFRNKVRCGLKTGRQYRLLYTGPCVVRRAVHVKKTITKVVNQKATTKAPDTSSGLLGGLLSIRL